ncbi:MAG TPA: heparan-alpha-glucosaminide N-acetyltransferase domain-containing protein [Flavisolibacter sp.]|nr:heparan-alpha-glucosaminide N-acetyltransferase domain-containing protein [Flavisolibacter sp.]
MPTAVTSAIWRRATLPPLQNQKSFRVESIDLLRGLVMIIMALDHTRDFFHAPAFTEDPLNLQSTTPILFFTRWITHFCAPIFVFLAGTSAYFQSARKTTKELSGFLIKRGLWLILVEMTLVNFSFSFDIGFSVVALQTIWSIGISMCILGLVIWLPFGLIAALGLLVVLGHNSLDFYEAGKRGMQLGLVYDLLHRPNFHDIPGSHDLLILYPFLPWTGLMITGYCFGKIFTAYEGVQRRKILTWLGLGIIFFFIVVRAINTYGDAQHWSTQKNLLYTVLSFIDTVKYPPSLLYMCMTIGPAILFLAWVGSAKTVLSKIITVYGKVPFFYYVLHFYLIHLLSAGLFLARGHSFEEGQIIHPNSFSKFLVPGEGYSLGIVYLIWIVVVASLYPLCKWFSHYKQTHKQWWLSYL